MMVKRLYAALVALVLAATAATCDSGGDDSPSSPSTRSTPTPSYRDASGCIRRVWSGKDRDVFCLGGSPGHGTIDYF